MNTDTVRMNGQQNGASSPIASYVNPEMTVRDYTKVLFRQKAIIVVTIFTVCLATFVGLKMKTNVYESQVKMLITAEKEISTPYLRDLLSGRDNQQVVTQSEIVKSNPVVERTADALGLYQRPIDFEKNFASALRRYFIELSVSRMNLDRYTPEQQKQLLYQSTLNDLKAHIKVEPIRDTNLFTITVRDYSPVGAAIIANTLSRSYVIFDLEQQLVELEARYTEKNVLVTQLQENIEKMKKTLDGQPLPSVDAIGPASVKIIEQAQPSLRPSGPSKKILFILAFVMSIFLGLMLAFMFETMDQSFRSKQDLENFLNVPVLACITRKKKWLERDLIKELPKKGKRLSPKGTSYSILTDQLHFLMKTKKLKCVIVSPIGMPEGAGVVVANLATFLSKKLGHSVLLVDADLRNPKIHRYFGLVKETGLSEALEGKIRPEQAIKWAGDKIAVITAGQSDLDASMLLDADTFENILKPLKDKHAIVLINCADLREHRDAAMLAPATDGVVCVVSESGVRRQVVRTALRPFEEKNINLIGAIMTNRDYPLPKMVYDSV